ncbi:hypothetical protein P43SY_008737 [Pythium insidiosum]|uniref:Transmembrane protein n=1 Tax=Pythium insidiosum TaxID=114742 RepID=A0AAD5LTV3_PYTIN|nr:hypothetical protein P43SY_008737 [Pythium insidiosum]
MMQRPPAMESLDERVSYLSSVNPIKSAVEFQAVKTPELEGGALREGPAPVLWSRECLGLLAQYCAIGLVYGTLPGTVYPFMSFYLNMEGTQTMAAYALLSLPWSFKFLFGFISDCFPIMGYRRRPYMLLGWIICVIGLVSLVFIDPGKPYWVKPEYAYDSEYIMAADKDLLGPNITNPSAKRGGAKFIVLLALATFGAIISGVASDAIVCEFAQREPEAVRGTTQTAIYCARTIFQVVANVLSGFFFNGKAYGGDYDFTLSFPQLMLVVTFFVLPLVPITWGCIPEQRVAPVNLREYFSDFWELLQSEVMYTVMAYQFFSTVFTSSTWVAQAPVMMYWIGVTNLNEKLSGIVGSGVFVATLWMTGRYGLHWDWRYMTGLSTVLCVAIDCTVGLLAVWDIVRNQWFWLGMPIVGLVPNGISFIISTFVVVELAGLGNEGIVYGLVTTVSNLGSPLGRTISRQLNALFDISNDVIQTDSNDVRWQVTYTVLIANGMMLLSLCCLVLLPRQKAETQYLRLHGRRSKIMAVVTICYVFFGISWALLVNILAIFPSTACLRIAGGQGC